MKESRSVAKVVAAIGGVTLVFFGLWALAAPSNFFETIAEFEPYNEHFLQDIGAFQLGLGVTLLLAAFVTSDALVAGLIGVGAGAALHVVSHLMSLDGGGSPGRDIPSLSVLGLALLAAGVWRWRQLRGPH